MTTYKITEIATGKVISYESDDAQQRLTDAELAAKGLQRTPSAFPVGAPSVHDTLRVKDSKTWTLEDVANWLKG